MTKKKKSPKKQQQPTEEIQTAGNKDIMTITGIKKMYIYIYIYISRKENEYGHNHFPMSLILPRYKI